MAKLVEVIPNFSEGRRPEVLDEIIDAILSVEGVVLLDKEMDSDHNRAVVTYVGEPQAAAEAAFRGIKKASEVLDLSTHTGEHPRMGATDVCPFVPISEVTTEECIELAKQVGERVGTELNIPVYLYELAASRPERVNLADVRRGQYEGIRDEIETNPDRVPDFGPAKMNIKAGATAVGVRLPLVAYNVYLDTPHVSVAKRIAKAIRSQSGGFMYCKALGFEIKERHQAQVSMNLVHYKKTPIFRVFEAIKSEANRWGVNVTSSEIIGLVPNDALVDVSDFYLKLENFSKDQILEEKLNKSMEAQSKGRGLLDFVESVASSSPAPGGGSVSACAGTLAAALSGMVCRLTLGKKKYQDVQDEMSETLKRADDLKMELYKLIQEDADAFDAVMAARKLPKDTDKQKEARLEAIQKATIIAAEVPLKVMKTSLEVMAVAQVAAEKGNVNSVSDAGCAALNARSAVLGAFLNVKINLPGIDDEAVRKRLETEADRIRNEAERTAQSVYDLVLSKI
ncbi:MAG: glutamate formimidoyltransferase [candidate division Zixibacteria bacterium]|nr:glutamate formimidoyltransferase [candidate division Zixibacteria bacterium]MBU1471910.1 glutamate formimidoyltransferase [candidate division Zixibacteria bacterium]MBU2626127.1 glutamate formimidoyltransferase [candidate division Zixibacteria bacterium]